MKKAMKLIIILVMLFFRFVGLLYDPTGRAIQLQEDWYALADEMDYDIEWTEGAAAPNRLGARWDAVIYDNGEYYSGMDCIVLSSKYEADMLYDTWVDRFSVYQHADDYIQSNFPQHRYFKWESGEWYYIVFQSGNLVIDFQTAIETKEEADCFIRKLIREI